MNPTAELAIVTSCHNYGQYLEEWASSILAQTVKPRLVGIYQNGSTDQSRDQAEAAAAMLREGGLLVRLEHSSEKLPFGVARNRAVALSEGCSWVMHLDADDMLMPHCLADVGALADHCDVVALGYERTGDLAAGPKQRRKLYRSSSGLGVLTNTTPASGVSPYRRSFWERSPYVETLAGGWDTALWIGFGHLGARILPSKRPCFWYRQHADSVFNTRRKLSWPTALVGNELQSRRRKDHGVSVLVPRSKDDGPDRVAAWNYVRARYAKFRPDWEIVEGFAPAVPWRKGEALREAVEKCRGKIAIVADADCLLDLHALTDAVRLVESQEAPWVVPHKLVHRLTQSATAEQLRQPSRPGLDPPPPTALARRAYVGFPAGGCLVLSRPNLQATGGIPAQFMGWGGEDEALAVILDTLLGPHRRLDSTLIHLWHPPQPDKKTFAHRPNPNRVEFSRIRSLAGDPEALWRYLGDPKTLPRRAASSLEVGPAAWRRQAWQERAAQHRTELAAAVEQQNAATLARQRIRQNGRPMPAKRDRTPVANKMMTGHLADKRTPVDQLQFATATAAHMAERNQISNDLLRRYTPPGAAVTVEMVRRAIVAKKTIREVLQPPRKAAAGDCGCGDKKPAPAAATIAETPPPEPKPEPSDEQLAALEREALGAESDARAEEPRILVDRPGLVTRTEVDPDNPDPVIDAAERI